MSPPDDRELLQEQLIIEAKRQRRDLRLLPRLLIAAVKLVWRTNQRAATAVVALQLSGALVASLQVLLAGYAVSMLVHAEGDVTNGLLLPLVVLAVVTLLGGLSTSAGTLLGRQLGVQVERHVTNDVLDVATTADLVSFDDPTFYNQLSRVLSNVPVQPFQVVTSMASLVGGLAGAGALVIALVALSPLIAILVVAAAPPMWLLARRGGAIEFNFAVAMTVNMRERQYIQDLLTRREGAAEARAYVTAPVLRRKFDELYDIFISASGAVVRRRFLLSVASALTNAVATALAMVVLYLLIREGAITLAGATSGLVAIRLLSARLGLLLGGVSSLFQSSLFLQDFDNFMTGRRATRIHAPRIEPGRVPNDESAIGVSLSQVVFRYPRMQAAALDHVTLDIPPGQVVAVVGENGSGKSTLAKLVAGLYEPAAGEMSWRRAEGEAMDSESARANTTLVLQDFARYQFTVRENISLGRPEAPHVEGGVEKAAVQAGLTDVVKAFPEGLDTRLSRQFEGGHELSLGQWQRLALARAFYRQGGLVVFDEPAAALDPRAERMLYDTVREYLRGRTVILITHRMLSAKGADRILVMTNGRVVEDGDHQALMASDGLYAELVRLQEGGGLQRSGSPHL